MANYVAFDPAKGQKIKTAIKGVTCDRTFLAHFQVSAADAVAASNTGIHAGIILVDGATASLDVNLTSPAVPRCVRIKGNAAGIVGDVVIEGTNFADVAITETIAANGVAVVEGAKAFKSITRVVVPARNAAANEIAFGWNDKIGLPYKLAHNTVDAAYLDNAKEGAAPTVTVSATVLESNTVNLGSALNGKVVDVYLRV